VCRLFVHEPQVDVRARALAQRARIVVQPLPAPKGEPTVRKHHSVAADAARLAQQHAELPEAGPKQQRLLLNRQRRERHGVYQTVSERQRGGRGGTRRAGAEEVGRDVGLRVAVQRVRDEPALHTLAHAFARLAVISPDGSVRVFCSVQGERYQAVRRGVADALGQVGDGVWSAREDAAARRQSGRDPCGEDGVLCGVEEMRARRDAHDEDAQLAAVLLGVAQDAHGIVGEHGRDVSDA